MAERERALNRIWLAISARLGGGDWRRWSMFRAIWSKFRSGLPETVTEPASPAKLPSPWATMAG